MRLPDKIRERIGDLQGEIGIYYYDFNRDTYIAENFRKIAKRIDDMKN